MSNPDEIVAREGEHQRVRASRYKPPHSTAGLRLGVGLRLVAESWPDWLSPSPPAEKAEGDMETGR